MGEIAPTNDVKILAPTTAECGSIGEVGIYALSVTKLK